MYIVAIAVVNTITLSRVILAAISVAAMHKLDWNTAWWFFIGAGITDILDGWLARRWNASTKAGQYIDLVTDVITCWILVWGCFTALQAHHITLIANIPLTVAIIIWLAGLVILSIPSGRFIINRSSERYWVRNGHLWYGAIPLAMVGLYIFLNVDQPIIMILPLPILMMLSPVHRHLKAPWRINR